MDPKLVKTFKELGDLYKILEIEPTDDKKAIKRAYKRQALINHPDRSKAVDAHDAFIKIEQAYRILTDTDLKAQFDKYKQNQQYHVERSAKQDKDRKRFADDLLNREKAMDQKNTEQKEKKMTKEEQQREESKKMKREWAQEEEKRKEELEKKKAEKVESKEYTMIKVKWPKNERLTYNEDILKIIFGKYGDIKDVVVFPADRKALIEFKFRLSAEKAYKENKTKEKEKMGFDDGLSVSLMVKEKEKEEQSKKPNDMTLNSNNIDRISQIFNRDSRILIGSKEEMLRQNQERQRVIDEILAKEGLSK